MPAILHSVIFRWRGWWLALLLTLLLVSPALAHRSGCHRWHSCPSDRGTYICGDLGYCSGCPDNQYCLNRKPRPPQEQQVPQELPKHKSSEAVASVEEGVAAEDDTAITAEEALWEAEGKWRSLVENAPDVVGPSSPVRSNEIKKQRDKG